MVTANQEKIEVKTAPTLPTLEKIQKSSFKIIIPEEVERKIRHLCNRVPSVEWSGTLFYTYSGSWEEDNLIINCKDIFVMDIGSAGYTEFDVNPDVVAYMCEHQELLEYQMGLIHSHNNMATFFSGTDTATLREEGNKRNHFVSLIVNNAGTYTAGITRKVIESKISETFKYGTFNDTIIESKRDYDAVDTIEWCNLEIVKEGPSYSFRDVDERLEEIKSIKAKVSQPSFPFTTSYPNSYTIKPTNAARTAIKDIKRESPRLFDYDTEYIDNKYVSVPDKVEPDVKIPTKLVQSLLLQLITGSVAIQKESAIDPIRWATSMEKVFDKRFEDMATYRIWAEQFCEFIICYPTYQFSDVDEQEYASAVSMALIDELEKLPENKYIEELKDCLSLWIM